jgi:hypothetical protein
VRWKNSNVLRKFVHPAHAFRIHNCEALTVFDEAFKNSDLLVAHVSCKQQIESARSSALSFFDPSGRIKNLIVVGSETADDKFEFDWANSVLTVPAGDSYEHLSMKVHQMVLFLTLSSANCSVLKVDDDVPAAARASQACCKIDLLKRTINVREC